jgi:hypothetical protein
LDAFANQGSATATSGAAPQALSAPEAMGGSSGSATGSGPVLSPAVGTPSDTTRIVETGDISLQVTKGGVPATVDKLSTLATSLGGRVASSNSQTYGDSPSASVVLRVPVATFQQALAKAQSYGKVVSSSTSGEDVTSQYTDQSARLHALQASRSSYLTLLSRASSIGEVLSVQQRIDDVQQQIESLQGQLKLLADQSDLSTLTVSVSEKVAPSFVPTKPESGIGKAWHDGVHGFTSGFERIIAGSGTALLLFLCVGVVIGIVRVTYKITRRRLHSAA